MTDPGDGQPAASDGGPLPASIEEALLEAAAELPGVTLRSQGGYHEFVVGGTVVATVGAGVAEYRLDPAVAAAALRTPGTRPSAAAADRIAFEPRSMDRYATDRAVAWLASAVRRAG